jgi:hypothetical protein
VPLVSTLAGGSTGVYHWLHSGRMAFSAGIRLYRGGDPGGGDETPGRYVSETATAEAVAADFSPGFAAGRLGAGRGGGTGRGGRRLGAGAATGSFRRNRREARSREPDRGGAGGRPGGVGCGRRGRPPGQGRGQRVARPARPGIQASPVDVNGAVTNGSRRDHWRGPRAGCAATCIIFHFGERQPRPLPAGGSSWCSGIDEPVAAVKNQVSANHC